MLELNEMPNEGGRFAIEFVMHLFNFLLVKKNRIRLAIGYNAL